MARINNLTNFVTDVANAIKTKSGISRTITPSEFDTLIGDIQTGTDVSDTTALAADVEEGKVFYTSDGTRTIGTKENLDSTITALEQQVDTLQNALDNKVATSITEVEYEEALSQISDLFGELEE